MEYRSNFNSLQRCAKMSADLIADFLRSAPPGEYEQCSACIRDITSDISTLREARQKSLKEWTFSQYSYVNMGDHGAIICKEAESDGYYIDPVVCGTFSYDFKTRQASAPTGGMKYQTTPLRNALQAKLLEYVNLAYGEDRAAGCYDQYADGSIVIILRSSSISLKNFRTGNVISRYTLSRDGTLSGYTETTQHFFERGNAMATNRTELRKTSVDMSCDINDIAAEVTHNIVTHEESWLKELHAGLKQAKMDGLKMLRRKLSITGEKVNWRKEFTVGTFNGLNL